jgi:hypothetical protein
MLSFDCRFPAYDAQGQRHAWSWTRFALLSAVLMSAAVSEAASIIFYPPVPPPLGAPLPARDAAGVKTAVPVELAAYVNECFYAPLSTRLGAESPAGKLSDALRIRLDAYRATKVALQTELRAKIDLLRETDAASRLAGLEQFAREQTPRIAALEESAEALRRDLVADGAAPPGGTTRGNESSALRAAAFYREGLSSDQRRLLREAALEMDTSAMAGIDGPWFFFSPESSRIRPFTDLTPELVAKVRAYQDEKNALKRELRVAVTKSSSPPALAALAAQQAPRITALESLAEEIRRGLLARNDPTRRPDLSPLPADLNARIAAYRREKLDLQKALLTRVDEVTKSHPTSRQPTDKRISTADASATQQQEKIREAIAAFTRENQACYTALDKSRDGIRGDLARLTNATGAPGSAPSADALLKKFSEALQQLEVWRNYRDYQIAVLQPGLSPEQRRLLFDAGLEKLALQTTDGASSP